MGLSSDDKHLLRVLFGGSLLDYREATKIIRRQPSSFSESDKRALVKLVYLKSAVYPGSVDRAKFLINRMSSAILKRFLSQHFDSLVERQYKLSVIEESGSVAGQAGWGFSTGTSGLPNDVRFGDMDPAVFEGEPLYGVVLREVEGFGYFWTGIISSDVTVTGKHLQIVLNLPQEQTYTVTTVNTAGAVTAFTNTPSPSFANLDYLRDALSGKDVGVDLSLVDAA